jgi:hypothetical protein
VVVGEAVGWFTVNKVRSLCVIVDQFVTRVGVAQRENPSDTDSTKGISRYASSCSVELRLRLICNFQI